MKKLLLSAIIMASFISCEKAPDIKMQEKVHHFSVTARMDELQDTDTKAVGENVIRLKWSAGDKVSVVNVTTGKALGGELSCAEAGNRSVFTGTLTGAISSGDKLVFIYPSQGYASEVDFTPIVIDYSVQSTSSPALVMTAPYTASDDGTSFDNVQVTFKFEMSFLRLNLSELPLSTAIQSISLNGMNDRLTISISGGALSCVSSSNNGLIKYTAASTSTDDRGTKTIFMGILQTPSASSRSVSAVTAAHTYDAFFTNAALYSGKSYNTSITGFIQSMMSFKDAAVKAKCIELFDKNGDGKLSFLEAAAVKDLGVSTKAAGENPFPTSILHFAELQFFTGLLSIPSFQNCTMLKTVAVPPQITSIPANAFYGCSALEAVVLTSGTPPSLGSNAFSGCDPDLLFYVPTEAVTAYKTAWTSVAAKVRDIAEAGTDFGLEGWSSGGGISGSAE